ncbi:helix-turn-helix domain-containing protein [Lacinutrix mariniflava]|uniref:helix-turn-helix domain-containing protein n=1 Tax=Lacinutrix mariniflava TaxID=342955 RepID=UPI0006E371C5|nr:helix-turn-helix domain-containing protein [Lacinutrix mariniflava]
MSQEIENIVFSEFVNQPVPFELISIENLYARCNESAFDLYNPHRIEFHALIIVTEGKSKHIIDFKEQSLFPGVILPLSKGQVHSFSKALTIKGYVVSFDEAIITNNISEKNLFHFLHLYNAPTIHIGAENLQILNPYLSILKTELENPNINLKSDFINTALMTLLLQIKRLSMYQHNIFESIRFKIFIQFKQLIIQHHKETHNASDYANMLSISYKYLNDICKEITSKTAKTFIDSWILLEIKRNISEKKYTSQEIGYKMGFSEHSNFIRFFKKLTGVTPNKFREQI